MTIKYLVTGRAGMSNWEYTGSYAVKKTYGFKKIEDICKRSVKHGIFDRVNNKNRVQEILWKFNMDCIKADIDGEKGWKADDYQAAYDEDDANPWNCVDLIVKINSKSGTTTTIYKASRVAD
mgnify:CR=1 FL=1|tara:strand:+ start:228 stop:593 length:366 start_codon:yes stop_codon:yes gene_type:complete